MPRKSGNDSQPEYTDVGDRLRAARRSHGLSLRRLADRLGVSPSLISQVERGRAKPSVSTLYAIANELGISLDELLFPDAAASLGARAVAGEADDGVEPTELLPAHPVQRASTRRTIRLATGVTWERLTSESIPNIDFLFVVYEVGGASSPDGEFQRHAGHEWGYIIRGRLGVTIGFDEYVLEPGDAIAFDSTTPHRLYNDGTEPVHGIWFVLGRRPAHVAPSSAAARVRLRTSKPPGSH